MLHTLMSAPQQSPPVVTYPYLPILPISSWVDWQIKERINTTRVGTLYTYIHTYIHTYIRKHTRACIHYITYIRTYIHTYIHTYICTLTQSYLDVATTSRTSSESFSVCSKREQQSHNRVNGASYDKEASDQQRKPPLAVTARGQSAPATDQLEE